MDQDLRTYAWVCVLCAFKSTCLYTLRLWQFKTRETSFPHQGQGARRTYACAHVHVPTYICTGAGRYICTRTCERVMVHMCMYMCTCAGTCVQVHVHVCRYMCAQYVNVCTYMCTVPCSVFVFNHCVPVGTSVVATAWRPDLGEPLNDQNINLALCSLPCPRMHLPWPPLEEGLPDLSPRLTL